ncbi:glycosyl hydrolase family 18 protein [Natrinema longum]|uniref:PKD domain-containing protein n=1 Tax=Natrinema longum TaxID=370324 RepID=A0A8A2U2L1_9EURY|nr:glycosyl hydrolase family 18 protein [Natrinema longum]MBZ6495067.1 PKD domain-containing protein [Natrinema longum]QSW83639.1 PKD domain-containing protein [Natrinema longum]
MKRSRRNVLSTASKISALLAGLGASSVATAQEYPEWDPDTAYTDGDRVVHDDSVWEAQWWTRGDEPGEGGEWGPWDEIESSEPEPPALSARIAASTSRVEIGEAVEFDGSESTGAIDSYAWAFGDGTEATGEAVTHTYDETGDYTVELTVTDADGETDTTRLDVTVRDEIEGPDDDFKVVGYYPGWKANDEQDYYPSDVPFDKVTDVLYAFIALDENGNVFPPENDETEFDIPRQTHEENLEQFADLADEADCRFHLSIGGWTLSDNFHIVAADPDLRTTFAESCVELMRQYNFDGIDIDWEHPGPQQGQCQCGNDDDYENHVLLLEELRDHLDQAGEEDGQHYYLSVANGGSDWNAGGLRHDRIGEICDSVYVMAYDFTGEWMTTIGLNAPLYGPDTHPTNDRDVYPDGEQYWAEYSVDELWAGDHGEEGYWPNQWQYPPADPAEYGELVLGMPFYGRGFTVGEWQSPELGSRYSGLPEGTWHHLLEDGADPTGSFDFGDIEENMRDEPDWEVTRHDMGEVPALVNEDEGIFISYDDEQAIEAKVEFAKERGMGGVMFWELSQDWNGTLLETILETI